MGSSRMTVVNLRCPRERTTSPSARRNASARAVRSPPLSASGGVHAPSISTAGEKSGSRPGQERRVLDQEREVSCEPMIELDPSLGEETPLQREHRVPERLLEPQGELTQMVRGPLQLRPFGDPALRLGPTAPSLGRQRHGRRSFGREPPASFARRSELPREDLQRVALRRRIGQSTHEPVPGANKLYLTG